MYWHPNGAIIRHVIETFWKELHLDRGYSLVYSPHIAKVRRMSAPAICKAGLVLRTLANFGAQPVDVGLYRSASNFFQGVWITERQRVQLWCINTDLSNNLSDVTSDIMTAR